MTPDDPPNESLIFRPHTRHRIVQHIRIALNAAATSFEVLDKEDESVLHVAREFTMNPDHRRISGLKLDRRIKDKLTCQTT